MIPNKVLLTGIVVAIIASLAPLLVDALGLTELGIDLSWLGDGDITLAEIVAFIGTILVAVSSPVRQNIAAAFGAKSDK